MSWFLQILSRDSKRCLSSYESSFPLVSSFTSSISSNSICYLFTPLQTLPVTFRSASKTPWGSSSSKSRWCSPLDSKIPSSYYLCYSVARAYLSLPTHPPTPKANHLMIGEKTNKSSTSFSLPTHPHHNPSNIIPCQTSYTSPHPSLLHLHHKTAQSYPSILLHFHQLSTLQDSGSSHLGSAAGTSPWLRLRPVMTFKFRSCVNL